MPYPPILVTGDTLPFTAHRCMYPKCILVSLRIHTGYDQKSQDALFGTNIWDTCRDTRDTLGYTPREGYVWDTQGYTRIHLYRILTQFV